MTDPTVSITNTSHCGSLVKETEIWIANFEALSGQYEKKLSSNAYYACVMQVASLTLSSFFKSSMYAQRWIVYTVNSFHTYRHRNDSSLL